MVECILHRREKKMVKHVSIFALKDKSEIKHFVEMLEEVGKNYPLIIKSEME